jgi:hypothetical protein
MPGGDFMKRSDATALFFGAGPRVLLTESYRMVLLLRTDSRARIVLLDVPREVRARRLLERGATKPLSLFDRKMGRSAGLRRRPPDLTLAGEATPQELVGHVCERFGLVPCACAE